MFEIDTNSYTTLSSDLLLEMSVVLMLPISFLSLLTKFSSFSLLLTIVWCLFWMKSSLIIISAVKGAWSDGLHKSSKIKWLLNSLKLAQRNIRLMTLNLLFP